MKLEIDKMEEKCWPPTNLFLCLLPGEATGVGKVRRLFFTFSCRWMKCVQMFQHTEETERQKTVVLLALIVKTSSVTKLLFVAIFSECMGVIRHSLWESNNLTVLYWLTWFHAGTLLDLKLYITFSITALHYSVDEGGVFLLLLNMHKLQICN